MVYATTSFPTTVLMTEPSPRSTSRNSAASRPTPRREIVETAPSDNVSVGQASRESTDRRREPYASTQGPSSSPRFLYCGAPARLPDVTCASSPRSVVLKEAPVTCAMQHRGQESAEPSRLPDVTCATSPASPALKEAMRELERLELVLVQERQKSAQLLEDRFAAEKAHTRDVAMLEGMLSQAIAENERLSKRLGEKSRLRVDDTRTSSVSTACTVDQSSETRYSVDNFVGTYGSTGKLPEGSPPSSWSRMNRFGSPRLDEPDAELCS